MNLSCTGNMSREIQCFTCGMPSSTEWAQKVRSRPSTQLKPYYPFLLTLSQPSSACIKEDGSTFVCAFCHASLEAQWKNYERQPNPVHPNIRKYNLYKFICACCGVETYRKRVRTLPFQEFPFLANSQRPPGSLTLGNNPLAVVCLDCSETLWAQSAEYDRWGLPVSKRHFNWMARPPPPEDSSEATVARLPSGAVRCPPTEPIIVVKPPKENHMNTIYEPPTLSKPKPRNSKSESTDLGLDSNVPGQTSRKTSLTDGVHPPIVVVNPTISSLRKESGYPKYEPLSSVGLHSLPFQRSPMFPGYPLNAEPAFTYPNQDGIPSSTATSWPWLPPPPSNLQYQSYIPSTFSNRSYSLSEPFYNSYYPPSSPETNSTTTSTSTVPTSSSSPYLIPYSLPTSGRSSPMYSSSSIPSSITTHSRNVPVNDHFETTHVQHRKISSDSIKVSITSSSPTAQDTACRKSSCIQCCSSNNNNNNDNHSKSSCLSVSSNSRGTIPKKSTSTAALSKKAAIHGIHQMNNNINNNLKEPNFKSTANFCGNSLPSNFKPKANAIRNHNNEKLLLDSSQYKSSSINNNNNNNNVNTTANTSISVSNQIIHPKKWQWQSQNGKVNSSNTKNRSRNLSECEPMDFSSLRSSNNNNTFKLNPTSNYNEVNCDSLSKHNIRNVASKAVVNLSSSTKQQSNQTSSKFMIAYLCQSESTESQKGEKLGNSELSLFNNKSKSSQETAQIDILPRSGRSSVIVTLPKSETLTNSNDESKCIMIKDEGKEEKEAGESSHENCHSSIDNDSDENSLKLENVSRTFEDMSYSSSPQNQNTTTISNSVQENTNNLIIDEMETETVLISKKETKKTVPQLENNEQQQHIENFDEIIKQNKDGNGNSDKSTQSVQKLVNEIIEEYKLEDRNIKLRKRKLEEDQEQFLGSLGLITPKKKLDLELDSLISRCERSTLPLIKFRPNSPPALQVSENFEKKLLQIAFDDPSLLKKSDLNQEEVAFLAELDLKPASRHEKTLREKTWRYILTEKMLREKRGKNLRGIKKLWESYNRVFTRFPILIKSPRNHSSDILGSLSLTLPDVSGTSNGGSDLLSIVDNSPQQSTTTTPPKGSITVSAMCVVQPVMSFPQIPQISIPKYIPRSCQVSVPLSLDSTADSSPESSNVAHHHVNSGPSSSRCQSPNNSKVNKNSSSLKKIYKNENINDDDDDETNYKIIQENENSVVNSNPCSINSRILKVPIINNTKSVPNAVIFESNQENNKVPEEHSSSSSTSELQNDSTQVEDAKNLPNSIDSIIEADKLNCTNLEQQINNLLNSISKIEDWKKMRKYIQSRQEQTKILEDKVKKKEKQILKKLRASNTKNTQ